MSDVRIYCEDIVHTFGAQADGSWVETYTDDFTGAVLFTQPIPPHRPSRTPPAQVGQENGWCESVATTQTEPVATAPTVAYAVKSEPGMGSFFLLVVVLTSAIGAIQQYRNRPAPAPQFLPHPWNDIPAPSEQYGALIEQLYPPRPDEHLTPETLPTTGPTEHQPQPQPDTNQAPTEPQPDTNQALQFDPREPEKPGEFELFQALIRIHDWSPNGKDILKALWNAQPKTKRYDPAVERRNLFANRLKEHAINEQK